MAVRHTLREKDLSTLYSWWFPVSVTSDRQESGAGFVSYRCRTRVLGPQYQPTNPPPLPAVHFVHLGRVTSSAGRHTVRSLPESSMGFQSACCACCNLLDRFLPFIGQSCGKCGRMVFQGKSLIDSPWDSHFAVGRLQQQDPTACYPARACMKFSLMGGKVD